MAWMGLGLATGGGSFGGPLGPGSCLSGAWALASLISAVGRALSRRVLVGTLADWPGMPSMGVPHGAQSLPSTLSIPVCEKAVSSG